MEEGITQGTALAPIVTTGWVFLGIILSLVLPVAVRTLQNAQLESAKEPSNLWERIAAAWKRYGGNRYLGIILSATLVAAVLVFLLGLKFYTPRDAVLAGFAWESFINKVFGSTENT